MLIGNNEGGLQLLDNVCYFCPGESLTYECAVVGEPGGTTVWTGTAFNCGNHEISLFHGDYKSTKGAHGECGDITGQSIRVDANTMDGNNSIATEYYVSQLIVNISSGANGTIDCHYDDGTTATSVGDQMILPATIGT